MKYLKIEWLGKGRQWMMGYRRFGPQRSGPQSPKWQSGPHMAIWAPGPVSPPSSNKCVRYWGLIRRTLNLFRQSTHLITHLCTPLQLCICSKSKSMESFENLLGPDAASGRAAIWAPAIGVLGPRSPPCLCKGAIERNSSVSFSAWHDEKNEVFKTSN